MPDERLLFALITRGALMALALINLHLARRQYREFGDSRGLRGLVAALTMLFGAIALAAGAEGFRAAVPAEVLLYLRTVGVAGFVVGVAFSAYTWTLDHGRARRRGVVRERRPRPGVYADRGRMTRDRPYDGRGDH